MINIVGFMGPSGSGKTTLARFMNLRKVTTFTTRPPREGERDGIDYFFLPEGEFLRLYREGELLEYTSYNGYLYGTGIGPLRTAVELGELVLIVVDGNGAKLLREVFPDNVVIIGVRAPLEECVSRMEERKEPDIQTRSSTHGDEMDRMLQLAHITIENSMDSWWKSRIIVEGIGEALNKQLED
ncbi:guanylate kinase [Gudongella sp. SC589]|uniref:guanylate kinase n=1 Tax=Gudongella sp. SC589 TaxID=3385990 RepID=UPI0039048F76